MCGVITSVDQCALCARSTHDVHHEIVGVNVVIGVLVVHCELHVVRVDPVVVCDDVVVRRTLVLIALHRSHCLRRSHFFIEFCCMGDILFTPPVGDSELLLAVTEFLNCNSAPN